MRPTIFMMRGLPASGKSTKRKEMLSDSSLAPIVAVNKDSIRREMGITPGDFKREKEVAAEETRQITKAIRAGTHLIIDNTHNSPKYVKRYQDLASEYDYDFVLIDLSDVPVEECIRRDALRTGADHVGEAVILRMYNDFYNKGPKKVLKTATLPAHHREIKKQQEHFKPRPVPIVQDTNLPKCLIVDLDGTLALANGRSWYEYSRCESDIVVEPIRDIVNGLLYSGTVEHLIFLTGREDSGKVAAQLWLHRQAGFDTNRISDAGRQVCHLFMKKTGDHRSDVETKRELFDLYVRDKFYVLAILEDRNKVVSMWREMGLTCLQVADGDY